ncbi:MAG TPA: methylmalonyl-CoA epimerase [Ktedonobacterales bacterium]
MLSQPVKRLDHVAVAVHSLDDALRTYKDLLGLTPSQVLDFPSEGVRIAFLPLGGSGGSTLELLEPLDASSGMAAFLEKRGEGLHHICLEVADIAQALSELQAQGARVLDTTPRQTAEGRGIFLHPKGASGVLLELVERDDAAQEEVSG